MWPTQAIANLPVTERDLNVASLAPRLAGEASARLSRSQGLEQQHRLFSTAR